MTGSVVAETGVSREGRNVVCLGKLSAASITLTTSNGSLEL